MKRAIALAALLVSAQALAWPACVTAGTPSKFGETIFVDDPITRIIWREQRGDYAGIVFTWKGALPGKATPAASGDVLRQIGVLVHARNACNGVYVMWHEERNRLRVLAKSSPGKTEFAECGAHGYTNLKGEVERNVQELQVGARHLLEAAVAPNGFMTVKVNRVTVWHGKLPETSLGGGGAGFRSDNVAAEVAWLGGAPGGDSDHKCARHL